VIRVILTKGEYDENEKSFLRRLQRLQTIHTWATL